MQGNIKQGIKHLQVFLESPVFFSPCPYDLCLFLSACMCLSVLYTPAPSHSRANKQTPVLQPLIVRLLSLPGLLPHCDLCLPASLSTKESTLQSTAQLPLPVTLHCQLKLLIRFVPTFIWQSGSEHPS